MKKKIMSPWEASHSVPCGSGLSETSSGESRGYRKRNLKKRFGWHKLSHSLATFLSDEVDPAVTMKLLRHKRLATTMETYPLRVNSEQRRVFLIRDQKGSTHNRSVH